MGWESLGEQGVCVKAETLLLLRVVSFVKVGHALGEGVSLASSVMESRGRHRPAGPGSGEQMSTRGVIEHLSPAGRSVLSTVEVVI